MQNLFYLMKNSKVFEIFFSSSLKIGHYGLTTKKAPLDIFSESFCV